MTLMTLFELKYRRFISGREDVPHDIIERILQCCHVDLLVYYVSDCLSYYVEQFMLVSIKVHSASSVR